MKLFSILMSVYDKENPNHLEESFLSIINQTYQPSEIVIVKDGPLNEKLDAVIDKYVKIFSTIKVVPLGENVGLGKALNIGLKYCSYDIVARMDADDISERYRFEKQINFLLTNINIAVVGSNLHEFNIMPHDLNSFKNLPENHNEIVQFSKYRCPINHPTVMFRKEAIIEAGSYQTTFPEDYDLWLRVIAKGYKLHNLQEHLLHFRRGNMIAKRKGIKYIKNEVCFFFQAYKLKQLSLWQLCANLFIKIPVRLLPSSVLSIVYSNFLRSKYILHSENV